MDIVNIADLAGFLFLGFGLLDGYRKGLVKKGASLLFTVGSLFLVYLISPYVENFLRQILPSFLNLDNISVDNDLYRLVMLSGFQDQAEEYVRILAARVISLVATYVVVRLILPYSYVIFTCAYKSSGLKFSESSGRCSIWIAAADAGSVDLVSDRCDLQLYFLGRRSL